MKFCTFALATDEERAGWIQSETHVVDMNRLTQGALPARLIEFLQATEANLERARAESAKLSDSGRLVDVAGVYPIAEVRMMSPLPRPASVRDFYAFENHVKTARQNRGLEMVPEWYQFPVFYFSNHQAVIGPEDEVEVPPGCAALDYELELACVVGCQGRDIAAEVAESYIFGYCVMNDWSARDIQREEVKVGLGPAKGKDFATALGPYIVTPDELERYRVGDRYDLTMTASVNGKLLSKGNYQDIYFSMPALLERAAMGATLYPGDIIGTGTVGTGCILELGPTVHRWLQPGDVVELAITGLGVLRNRVAGS